jgi:hypothetical protein
MEKLCLIWLIRLKIQLFYVLCNSKRIVVMVKGVFGAELYEFLDSARGLVNILLSLFISTIKSRQVVVNLH